MVVWGASKLVELYHAISRNLLVGGKNCPDQFCSRDTVLQLIT